MSKLDELIAELCPNGVEYKKLKEVASVSIGEFVHKNKQNPNGVYPVYNGGTSNTGFYDEFNRTANKIIISARGANAGFVNRVFVDFWAGNSCYTISVEEKYLDWNFTYYVLKSSENNLINQQQKGGIPAVSKKQLEEFYIPVPPLPVQQEIVRILDTFTELNIELNAELEARRKQYEYYRNLLLTFDDARKKRLNIKWMRLGEIGRISMCKRIMKVQTTPEGEVPFYKIGTFGGIPDAYISKELYEEYKSKYPFPKKGDVLISASGTIGRTVIYDGKPAYFQDSNIIWVDNDEKIVLNKYLYYYYQLQPWKVSTGGVIKRLYNYNLEQTVIAVPPLEEQQRIVNILDRFDTLINDPITGILAEIEAREKQFKYYLNKLLDFKEVSS